MTRILQYAGAPGFFTLLRTSSQSRIAGVANNCSMSSAPLLFLPRWGECRPGSPPEPGVDGAERSSAEQQAPAVAVMTASQQKHADRRASLRSHLQLRFAVIYPQQAEGPARPMYHGKTHDLSMSGISMVVDYNVFHEGEVALVLALPLAHPGAARKVVTCSAVMTYAIYSSKLNAFKIGLAFRAFRGDGKAQLEAALRRVHKETGRQTRSGRFRARRPRDSQPLGC